MALVLGVLVMSTVLFPAPDAQIVVPGPPRLELVFSKFDFYLYHQWSYDGGATWSGPTLIPNSYGTGTPSIASDQVGRFKLAWRAGGYIEVMDYVQSATPKYSARKVIASPSYKIGPYDYTVIEGAAWRWLEEPVVTSWGPGRYDVFIIGLRYDGAKGLLHTWFNNNQWVGSWEVLGTAGLQGGLSAVSWGPGRIDIFARGVHSNGTPANGFLHKWFDGGRWYAWEHLAQDGFFVKGPAVLSQRLGHLDVYGIGTSRRLYNYGYDFGQWWFWSDLGGDIDTNKNIAVASRGVGNEEAFVYGWNGTLYQRAYNEGIGWIAREVPNGGSRGVAALYWIDHFIRNVGF